MSQRDGVLPQGQTVFGLTKAPSMEPTGQRRMAAILETLAPYAPAVAWVVIR